MHIPDNADAPKKSKQLWGGGESIEFAGKAVANPAADVETIMSKSGKILWTSHLSREYKFEDVDGRDPSDFLSVKYLMELSGHTWLSAIVPSFIRVPLFLVHQQSYKF